tara:strand:+ start:926 stop:1447 length:522 start_codon:yes stop_codon:yes gene_type:complete
MRFKDFKKEGKKLGIGGGNYYRIEPGENKIRLLSECEPVASHFTGGKPEHCTMDDSCKLCISGSKKNVKVLCYIYDYEDSAIKEAELPWSVMKQIGELAESSEYGFEELPLYDIIIKKSGEGMETRYLVTPGKNEEPLSEEIMADLDLREPILALVEKRLNKARGAGEDDMPF